MSLDVYLYQVGANPPPARTGIFVRRDGATVEIDREEWDSLAPGREPVICTVQENETDEEVYWRNITHNLGKMASAAELYDALWRPDENGIEYARQLIEPLTRGLARLRTNPEKYRKHNPENNWGSYEGLVAFVEDYLRACITYPHARVTVSR